MQCYCANEDSKLMMSVLQSGRHRSSTAWVLVAGRSTFSFYKKIDGFQSRSKKRLHKKASPPTIIIRIWKKWVTYSIKNSQVHSHYIDPSGEMNPLGNITKEVMVEAIHIKGISTLQKVYDNLYIPCKRTVESNTYSCSSAASLVVAHTVLGSVRATLLWM